MQSNIIVNLQVEAIHHWPECPIEEVAFLKDKHRHIFHIECKKEVTHLDRDIEIIQLKRQILEYLKGQFKPVPGYNVYTIIDFETLSCEQIAAILLEKFELNYCKVLEDGENGAELIR